MPIYNKSNIVFLKMAIHKYIKSEKGKKGRQ